jgi:hypothetical protein
MNFQPATTYQREYRTRSSDVAVSLHRSGGRPFEKDPSLEVELLQDSEWIEEPALFSAVSRAFHEQVTLRWKRLLERLHEASTSHDLELEHDISVQLPPKRSFSINATAVFQGRAKPKVIVDLVAESL